MIVLSLKNTTSLIYFHIVMRLIKKTFFIYEIFSSFLRFLYIDNFKAKICIELPLKFEIDYKRRRKREIFVK